LQKGSKPKNDFAIHDFAQKNTHPKSSGMNYLTWKESAEILMSKVVA